MDLNDSRIANAIQTSSDWRAAVTDVVALFVSERRCFSSGEVASAIRLHRKDLRFEVPKMGAYIREQFYNQALPSYLEADGTTLSPVQVSRFTTGRFPTRTPAQTEVFVYGPEVSNCHNHEFEVYIPKPGETLEDAPVPAVTTTAATTGPGSLEHTNAVAAFSAQPAMKDIRASVWPDGRCSVPRTAFEAACHLGGAPIRQGEPVYVTVESGVKAVITLVDPQNGAARSYSVWKDQGRIAFTNPVTPFEPGKSYKVSVAAGEITVDLSNPL